jgi:hypothetical protein
MAYGTPSVVGAVESSVTPSQDPLPRPPIDEHCQGSFVNLGPIEST